MLESIKEKWNEILTSLMLEYDVSEVSFKTWLQPLIPHSVENNILIIVVPIDNIPLQYINKKYYMPLCATIEEITGHALDVKFILPSQVDNHTTTPAKTNNLSGVKYEKVLEANLNPKYTFDTFVVGTSNNFAHAYALAVAESPGEMYNPLFIYGGVGLGKTHLMHSIAHFIIEKDLNKKVLYVTSEAFTNELINVIRNENQKAIVDFRNKYRNIDVLLIDDIQFIIGKERSQEEFFHTFNTLHLSKKQIIISSDKPPKDFDTLEDRLRTRFECGLTVDISSPDYETRMAILRKKADIEGYNNIDESAFQYIADHIKSNIRELEGALNKIIAYTRIVKTDKIDNALAEIVLKDSISPNANKEITPEFIINIVAQHFNIPPSDIGSKKKNKEVVYPRQISMYLCRTLTENSLSNIGYLLGKKDHSTVLHGIDKIKKELEINESTRNTIELLKKKLMPNPN